MNYLYQITNLVNNKIYVGVHKTDNIDDGYMGSGKRISYAIEKYGIHHFRKEILEFFDTYDAALSREAEIVTAEFLLREDVYNLRKGGFGGFDYINTNEELRKEKNQKARLMTNSRHADKLSEWAKIGNARRHEIYGTPVNFLKSSRMTGKLHSAETKQKQSDIGKLRSGAATSGFGSMWITDGNVAKKVKNTETIPNGWYRGRK
jgi:hypothetical protein